MEKNCDLKKYFVIAGILVVMLFNISSVSAKEWGSVTNNSNWNGISEFDYDSIKIEQYKPPIYVLSVFVRENKGMFFMQGDNTYKLNYDTKEVSKFFPADHIDNSRGYDFWTNLSTKSADYKIAVLCWERAYNMKFNPKK